MSNYDDSEIESVVDSLLTSLTIYRDELKAHGLPPLSAKKDRPTDAIDYIHTPKMFESKRIVLATLGLLTDAIQSPMEKLVEAVLASTQSASLQIAVRLQIASLLSASESSTGKGLTIDEIATQTEVDPSRIGSPMHLLTAMGWFEEKDGGRFVNNRFSEELKARRHAANVTIASETWNRSWAFQAEAACRPDWRMSRSPFHTGTQLAHRTEKLFFDFLLEDKERHRAFIDGVNAFDNSVLGAITVDFPWEKIPNGTTMVDVGGGIGSLCIAVAKCYPHLSFIVQELAAPAKQAKLSFAAHTSQHPELKGRLDARVQDFFEPQKGWDIGGDGFGFMLKWVLHNWPEAECVKILSHLVAVAGPNSPFIIFEHLIQSGEFYTTGPSAAEVLSTIKDDEKYTRVKPVPYVAPTFGRASTLPLSMSFCMGSVLNASERPVEVYKRIFDEAGLELVQVYPMRSWVWAMEGRKKRV